jgi:HYDIN/CFA65/VesB family protein/immunoglobulin I-set domain protein
MRRSKEFYTLILCAAIIATILFMSGIPTHASPAPQVGCLTSSTSWINSPLSQTQTGSFRFTFDSTPSGTAIDSVAGLSSGPSSGYASLAAIVRFNPSGDIDARSGGNYVAATAIPYSAGATYHFILDVNIATHSYNAYVVVGSVQTTIGMNLGFRTEQAKVTSLNNLGTVAEVGSQTICNATVTAVQAAPTITTQPASQTVIAGQTATFTVAATGTAPMSYQWKKTGAVISGATSSTYTTPATAITDNAAQFTVVVTNSAGSATSAAAILTVNAATRLLNPSATSLNFGNVTVSTSSSQNATLTNAGNSSLTISNVSISGAGFGVTGLSTGLILNPGQAATLTATFTPATTGSASGSVTVTSNASNSPDTIALSGTGQAPVAHSVSLSWTPSTSSVIGYNSYSSTKSGGPYAKLTATPVPTASYTDTTVQAGQTYYYVVTAVDSSNVESAYSNEVSAIVP